MQVPSNYKYYPGQESNATHVFDVVNNIPTIQPHSVAVAKVKKGAKHCVQVVTFEQF